MTLLIRPRATPPPPIVKNRTEVTNIVKRAPTGKRSLEWWQRWLASNWA